MTLEQALDELDDSTALREWIDNYLSVESLELLAIELSDNLT